MNEIYEKVSEVIGIATILAMTQGELPPPPALLIVSRDEKDGIEVSGLGVPRDETESIMMETLGGMIDCLIEAIFLRNRDAWKKLKSTFDGAFEQWDATHPNREETQPGASSDQPEQPKQVEDEIPDEFREFLGGVE